MSNSGEVIFLTEEIENMIDNLKPGQIQIIERFDPELDFGRLIPSWELNLRITKGKARIYTEKYFYPIINALIDLGIVNKLDGTTNYMLTKLGEEIRKKITPRTEESIPISSRERMSFIQEEISKRKLFSKNEYAMKTWTERYFLVTQKFYPLLKDESEISKKRFVTALGLTTWNSFYQPKLISIKDFLNMFHFSEIIEKSHIYVICQYFQWKYHPLDKDLWFVSKNLSFWRERYNDLIRYNFNQSPKKALINNSMDLDDLTQQTKKFLRNRDKIVNKSISDLANEILFQKGHYWDKRNKNDFNWIKKRLNLILF